MTHQKLNGYFIVDVPRMVCLPSLKTLHLQGMSYVNKDSLQRLLSNCPVLEDLWIYDLAWNSMGKFIAMIPSLQRLSLLTDEDLDEFVIDIPSLEYLNLTYFSYSDLYVSIKNMPNLREAILWISSPLIKSLIESISSVKRLTLCLSFYDRPEVLCDDGFVFNKLKHLKLCACQNFTPDVLVQLLNISPNLRSLELFVMDGGHDIDFMFNWDQPSTVPECMLSSLQTFKWSGYNGSEEQKDIVIYVLQNACRLKTATISFEPNLDETLDMVKELAFSSRASTKCQLVFH